MAAQNPFAIDPEITLSDDDDDAPENRPHDYNPQVEDIGNYYDWPKFPGLARDAQVDIPAWQDRPAGLRAYYVPYWTDEAWVSGTEVTGDGRQERLLFGGAKNHLRPAILPRDEPRLPTDYAR